MWLVVVAALIRKGVFPFHAWIPEIFDRGRIGPTVLLCAPQMGSYVTAVLILPRATPEVLHVVAILALVTAAYGAALALVQTDARRACGYLFVSQSALVMAGLDCRSQAALSGSLVLWISSALAFAGLARIVLVLEARRGRLDLSRYHGGFERMPMLALSFLAMGLACTGFPGTLGFVGSELLLGGATAEFPLLGFFVVLRERADRPRDPADVLLALLRHRGSVDPAPALAPRGVVVRVGRDLPRVERARAGAIVSSRNRAGERLLESRPAATRPRGAEAPAHRRLAEEEPHPPVDADDVALVHLGPDVLALERLAREDHVVDVPLVVGASHSGARLGQLSRSAQRRL